MSDLRFMKLFLPMIILFSGALSAQQLKVFDDLKEFGEIPKTWKMVGGVSADWEHDDFLSTSRGTGILVNPPKSKNGPHFISGFEHGDMELELEFMVPKGSNSGIYLQGRYEVQIFDSWGKINPNSGDAGGIYQRWDKEKRQGFEGKAPRMNVSKAPGLWQHFKIVFEAPRFNAEGVKVKNAKFVHVFQNGILIHENVEVTGPTTSAMFEDEKALGPIVIQGDHGPVAIRNIKYKPFGNPVPQIKDLKYAYYKGKFQSVEEFLGTTPTATGQLNKITWDLGHGVLDFAYEYTGKLEIPKSGDYTFSLTTFGTTSLYLNGENVLKDLNDSPRSKTLPLKQGVIPFKLVFYKNNYPGRRPQLGFFVEGPGIKKSPLHDPNSYVEHVIQKPFYLEPTNEPMILRGFFRHAGNVKTHTVGVGEPSGSSFAYDLQQGALLSIWRGGFLDTSPMWRQRGESQLMIPNGALVELVSGPTIARLDNKNSPWPDSLSSDLLHIKGYFLNRDRRPTFKYVHEQIAVEDFFEPEMDGKILTRTISYINPQKISGLYARIISAEKIEDFGEGVYHINQGQLYVKLANNILSKALLRDTTLGQELLIPISTEGDKNEIKYSLIY
ncbi:MAG: family 16 glycoside hydrolase [Candidatus Curtissbacteria bacterium]